MALHLIKLCVGVQGLGELRARQSAAPLPLRHRTRNFPRRAADLLDGGSIYWVINRLVTARQRLLDIAEAARDDGSRCTDLLLDAALVPVRGQFRKPFQGWRYLEAEDAPPDAAGEATGDALPDRLRRELVALGLL